MGGYEQRILTMGKRLGEGDSERKKYRKKNPG